MCLTACHIIMIIYVHYYPNGVFNRPSQSESVTRSIHQIVLYLLQRGLNVTVVISSSRSSNVTSSPLGHY